jgi:hypothetical protein
VVEGGQILGEGAYGDIPIRSGSNKTLGVFAQQGCAVRVIYSAGSGR